MEPLTLEALENVVDIYARVSSQEQAEEGYSIGEQEEKLKAYCVAMGYKVNRVAVDPGYSGASLDRPGIKEVIADVKRGRCKKVVVWKLDRLSRSQKDTLILLEDVFFPNGCAFVSLNENFDTATPIGRCIIGVLAAFAQMERENIKMRTMMGRQASARAGKFTGCKAPFGYQWNILDNGKREIIPDPYASIIVNEIYDLYNTGLTIKETTRRVMDKYGCFTHMAAGTQAGYVGRLMSNPVYAGNVRMNGEIFEGMHQALVTMETWGAANDRLSKNISFTQRGRARVGLVSGLIFCGCCGSRMSARIWGNPEKYPHRYMCYSVSRSCRNMQRDVNCTNRKHFTVPELDQLILDEISKLAADPDAIDSLMGKPEEEDKAGPVAERLEEVEKQINRLLNLYQTGVLDLEELQPRIADLKKERGSLTDCLEEMKEEDRKLSKSSALEIARAFPDAVAAGDEDELRRLIASLIDKIVILNREITIYWKFA